MTAERFIIHGSFTVVTPLAIRLGRDEGQWPNGASAIEPNVQPEREGANAGPAPIAAIELAHRGLPFLSASTPVGNAMPGL